MDPWAEVDLWQLAGWGGSALLVASLLQTRVWRLRLLNLAACVVLAAFNVAVRNWPMAAMNVALTAINLWFIVRLTRDKGEQASYTTVQVPLDDAYLFNFLSRHREDIARFFPQFPAPESSARRTHGRRAFLVQKGDETIGVVVAHNAGNGAAQLELDYVTRRYRDFSPGDWVYRRSGLFRDQGFRQVISPRGTREVRHYQSIGFRQLGDAWVLDV